MNRLVKTVLLLSCLCLQAKWTSSSNWYTKAQAKHDWKQRQKVNQYSDIDPMQMYIKNPILQYIQTMYDWPSKHMSKHDKRKEYEDPIVDNTLHFEEPTFDQLKKDSSLDKRSLNYENIPLLHVLNGGIVSSKLKSRKRKIAKLYSDSLKYLFENLPSQKRDYSSYVPILHRSPSHYKSTNTNVIRTPNVPILHQLVGKRSSAISHDMFSRYLNSLKRELTQEMPLISKRGSMLHFISGKGFTGSVVSRRPAKAESRVPGLAELNGVRTFPKFNADMGR